MSPPTYPSIYPVINGRAYSHVNPDAFGRVYPLVYALVYGPASWLVEG